jgi:branched-chain amino acid transport system substrate-binding protein
MFVSVLTTNTFAEVKIGIILGFTGPIESLTPAMAASAELAFKEASDSGKLLGGETITPIRADSTCVDSAAATTAAEGLIADGIAAIMGADCSGVTGAIASNVAVPNGVVMISPSATSPGLTTLDDKGLFFRTAPSDARGGQILADITKDRGVKSVAITYTNNDYGKGLADVYEASVKAHGISVTTVAAHEDGKADYSAEVAVLAAAGGDAVAVIGYLDQGGKGIIQGSIDSGAFDTFILSDGMIGQSLIDAFGKGLSKSFGSLPGSTGKGAGIFTKVASAAGIDSSGPYTGESYDAAALLVLAMQAGGSADRGSIAKNVMAVANGPGKKIYPGQLGKALDLLAKGKAIDYEGATGVTFTDVGESFGSFLEKEVKGGKFKTKKQR